jgi:ABC-2 type transport system permease protein
VETIIVNECSRSKFKNLQIIPIFLCVFLFGAHLFYIHKYSLNIPFWDEWESFRAGALSWNLNISWLFAQHNEHRIIFTKLINWILYRLDGWNILTSIQLNMFLFGGLVFSLFIFTKKMDVRKKIIWFYPFLFSSLPIENFNWGFQSQFHLFLGFFILSAYFLFTKESSYKNLIIGAAFAAMSAFSFSAGVVAALSIFMVFGVREMFFRSPKLPLKKTLFVLFIIAAAIGFWFGLGYSKPGGHPALSPIFNKNFLEYFFNIIALGFGITKISTFFGILCFGWIMIPIAVLIKNKKCTFSDTEWGIICLTIGLLACLGSISMGRAGFGVEQAKSSRYSEIGIFLIPCSIMLWSFVLNTQKIFYDVFLTITWIALCFSFRNFWNSEAYRIPFESRREGIECVKNYYFKNGPDFCIQVYHSHFKEVLDRARELHVSFYQDLEKNRNAL